MDHNSQHHQRRTRQVGTGLVDVRVTNGPTLEGPYTAASPLPGVFQRPVGHRPLSHAVDEPFNEDCDILPVVV